MTGTETMNQHTILATRLGELTVVRNAVELTNTRRRRSGVRMTGSSRGPWLTDRP